VIIIGGALLIAFIIWHFRTLPSRKDKERFEARKGGSGLSRF
jgi:hypothetical protein